jgi:hypothetical protein
MNIWPNACKDPKFKMNKFTRQTLNEIKERMTIWASGKSLESKPIAHEYN